MNKNIIIVIPVYNEEKEIAANINKIDGILKKDGIIPRFMLVDDGSRDESWQRLKALAADNSRIECARFSRNFGKEAAICAGLTLAEAELYLVMDSDLQHPPGCVKDMLALMEERGADIVDGVKSSRGEESAFYRFFANMFYRTLKVVSGLDLMNSSDFKLMSRKVVLAMRDFSEGGVFFRGLIEWSGFDREVFPFEVAPRESGASSFSKKRLIRMAVSSMLSYTGKPLYLTVAGGVIFLLIALALGIQTCYNYFAGNAVSGFSTVILLQLITGAAVMISLGIIGMYLDRIYSETKRRPRYIVSDRIGNEVTPR